MKEEVKQIEDIVLRMLSEAEKKNKKDAVEMRKLQFHILTEYKLEIRRRDGNQCMNCGNIEELGVYRIYLPSYAASNLITLCVSCGRRIKLSQMKYNTMVRDMYKYWRFDENGELLKEEEETQEIGKYL